MTLCPDLREMRERYAPVDCGSAASLIAASSAVALSMARHLVFRDSLTDAAGNAVPDRYFLLIYYRD